MLQQIGFSELHFPHKALGVYSILFIFKRSCSLTISSPVPPVGVVKLGILAPWQHCLSLALRPLGSPLCFSSGGDLNALSGQIDPLGSSPAPRATEVSRKGRVKIKVHSSISTFFDPLHGFGGKEIKSLQLFGLSLGCSGLLAGVVYGLQIEHSGSPGSCPDFPPPSPYGSLGTDCTPL